MQLMALSFSYLPFDYVLKSGALLLADLDDSS